MSKLSPRFIKFFLKLAKHSMRNCALNAAKQTILETQKSNEIVKLKQTVWTLLLKAKIPCLFLNFDLSFNFFSKFYFVLILSHIFSVSFTFILEPKPTTSNTDIVNSLHIITSTRPTRQATRHIFFLK